MKKIYLFCLQSRQRFKSFLRETKAFGPKNSLFSKFMVAFLLCFLGLLIFFPFYFMISTSLLTEDESLRLQNGESILFPSNFDLSNYSTAANTSSSHQLYFGALLSSSLVTFISITCRLFFTLSFGYAFSLPNWRFKKTFWFLFMMLLPIPETGILLGQFAIVQKTLLKDSFVWIGLTIPFVANVFSGYLFKNAFESIPRQIREAASLDGSSNLGYLFKIAIPMIRSTIWTVIIITAFGAWTSYMWPNMILGTKTMSWQPLSTWVFNAGFIPGADETRFLISIRLAASVLAILPMFIMYFVFRRRIMNAIMHQGSTVKGF